MLAAVLAGGAGAASSAHGTELLQNMAKSSLRPPPPSRIAVLAEGKTRQLQWGIAAFRGPIREAGRHPCFEEVDLLFGGFSRGYECGTPAIGDASPLLTGFRASFPRGRSQVGASTFGLLFDLSVVRVRLEFEDGPAQERPTRLLNALQAAKTHLRPFRYLAFAVARDTRLVRAIGYDSAGTVVLDYDQRPPDEQL